MEQLHHSRFRPDLHNEGQEQIERLDQQEFRLSRDDLLPSIDKLLPAEALSTFGECRFTSGEFRNLPEHTKLEVTKDILRSSMITNYYPNPETHTESLIGDCTTACLVYADYIKSLDIIKNTDFAIVVRRPFDPPNRVASRHMVVIARTNDDREYVIDPSAMLGYGMGTVSETDGPKKLYSQLETIDQTDMDAIGLINKMRYQYHAIGSINSSTEEEFYQTLELLEGREYMKSWISEGLYVQALSKNKQDLVREYQKLVNHAAETDLFKFKLLGLEGISENNIHNIRTNQEESIRLSRQCVESWHNSASELLKYGGGKDIEEAIRYLQWATHESTILLGEPSTPEIKLSGHQYKLSELTPRLLEELNLSTVWIKPSATYRGVESTIREALRPLKIVSEYDIDLAKPLDNNYIPLEASHPFGKDNIREYSGKTIIMLIEGDKQDLAARKRYIRQSMAKPIKNKDVVWHDGQHINWQEYVMNDMHSSDSSTESLVHFMLQYPEYVITTRWDYPNPAYK